ncbi:hypothetical protein T484DRAFT_1758144 [Baffinella frigidus]|nr:hypothetical protein T484DRAFT_1758144 [Cryptophyta sp. CCMP2293]
MAQSPCKNLLLHRSSSIAQTHCKTRHPVAFAAHFDRPQPTLRLSSSPAAARSPLPLHVEQRVLPKPCCSARAPVSSALADRCLCGSWAYLTTEDSDIWSNADTKLCEELEREQIREEVMLNNGIPTDEQLQRLGSLRHNARTEVSLTEPLMSSFGPDEPSAASSASSSSFPASKLRSSF